MLSCEPAALAVTSAHDLLQTLAMTDSHVHGGTVISSQRPDTVQTCPSPSLASRFSCRNPDEDEIDRLDNLVTARDKLELYNMLALSKDVKMDWR